jgi:hypothetical protein
MRVALKARPIPAKSTLLSGVLWSPNTGIAAGWDARRVGMTYVSLLRLYVMRIFYLLILLMVGSMALPGLTDTSVPITPMRGVALSFWAALAVLAALGIRYPIQMIPILLIQMLYKSIWLLAVALPLWRAGTPFNADTSEFARAMAIGIVIDLIVIPWGYVFANYVRRRSDRWTERGQRDEAAHPEKPRATRATP